MFFSNEKLDFMRQLLESAHNGVAIVDLNGTILLYNLAARKLMGVSSEAVLGRHIAELSAQAWDEMREVLSTGESQLGRRMPLGARTIIANRTPIKYMGKINGVLSIFQDVSEFEKMAAQLESYKHLSEQLDVIIESSIDGLWISDAQGKVVRVNQVSLNYAGLTAEEVVGKNVEEFVAKGHFDRSVTTEVLKHGTAVSMVQTQYNGKKLMITGNPVRDKDGNITLVVINSRDLSTLNRLRSELEESRSLTKQLGSELTQLLQNQDLGSQFILRSPAMLRIFKTAMRVARTDSGMLITGESGVGKGLLAKTIHQASQRKDGPLVRVDCGGIPESLIEAELFGYAKGSFTGASEKGRIGYFELAQGGTLMLDEVGELPLKLQAKLLRFLEDNEVVRVGSTTAHHVDVRVIAATNRDLEQMVAEGKFRRDLYFRLKVIPLSLPPLRQRTDDIPPLIHHFLAIFNEKCSTEKKISPAVVDCLCNYSFPGNVRELANLVEQIVVLTPAQLVELHHLPRSVRRAQPLLDEATEVEQWNLPEAVKTMEARMIKLALRKFGSQRMAARHLGIDHTTLSRKIKKYNISRGDILQRGVVAHQ